MNKLCFPLVFFIASFSVLSQVNEGLTPEERAYLYHIVKKSPILNTNFGRYFDYQGPEIRFTKDILNYDSMELIIMNQPELLVIRKEEIAKSPKGLIAEAANKVALWELNKALLARRSTMGALKEYQNEYEAFETLLMKQLPLNAQKEKNGRMQPHPRVIQAMNPGLSFDDKMIQLESQRFLSDDDRLNVIRAINAAVNEYAEKRSREIFLALGGKADTFENLLVAAGDGSSTTGMLEEREKNEKGIWNKGLPKAVGLFPYQVQQVTTEEGKKKKSKTSIEPLRYTINDFQTVGDNRLTNIHFDVWGYNSEKQTTVVIEKNGISYHLFGSGETRFLSPDSTFSSGKTFQSMINDLEHNKIAALYDAIYGKKGFDYQIAYNKKKKDQTELKIEKQEKEYSDLGYSPITTSARPSRKVKKSKRQAIKSGSGSFNGTPTTNSNRSQRKKLQHEIVHLYELFESYQRKIKELEVKKQEAIDLMATYQRKLDVYKDLMGRTWATYTVKDQFYTFSDSSTFDMLTQEFQFNPSDKKEDFEIRLIAIPESALSDQADEVMLHINLTDAIPDYDARIQLSLDDVFESDKWELPAPLFSRKDSVSLRVFFEGLLDKKVDFNIVARGQGVGTWDGNRTIKDLRPVELNAYPGDASRTKMDSSFLRLRKSTVSVQMGRSIDVQINSYTDRVKSSINVNNSRIASDMTKYKLSKNDILSAYRTHTILKALKSEVNVLAGTYLSREEAKIVIDRFNRTMDKTKITVGRTSFRQSTLESPQVK